MSSLIRCYPGDRCFDLMLVVTLVAALASSAAWLFSRRLAGKAALRHLVLYSALVCCLASPAVTWFCSAAGLTLVSVPILCGEQGRMVAGAKQDKTDFVCTPPQHSTDAPPVVAEPLLPHTDTTDNQSRNTAAAPEANQIAATSMPSAPEVRRADSSAETLVSFRGIATGVMFVWAAGALLMLARLARNCRRVVQLRRSSRPLRNKAHQLLLQEIAARSGMRQVPLLLVSSRTVVPLAVGFGRPAVILPERLFGAVSDNELRDILMHEAAHLQRSDQRIVLLQELAGALYWPIVSVHALIRELQRSREEVCDNVVLAGRDAISYGKTLLHVAELLVEARPMGAAVGIVGGRGELERRIAGLIDPRRNTMTTTGRKASIFVLSLFLAVGALLSATRFAASAPPEREGPQTETKPPAGTERSDPKPADKALSEEEKVNLAAIQWGLRNRHAFTSDSYEDSLIGGLVENGWWSSSLPLAPAQARAIKKLDELIRDAGDHAALNLADYLVTSPSDHKALIAGLDRRLRESLRHGERMAALGLLTEPQAAFVLYRHTSGSNHLYVLRDKNVQELLGMTASQNKQLDKVGDAATRREALLNLWTVEPVEQEYVRTVMAAIEKRMNAEALNVLTPSQREVWSRLTAARSLPAKPPNLPAPSEAEAARIRIREVSPVFRVLNEKADAFKLSDAQKKLLNRLEEITRVGLYWISLRNSKNAAPTAPNQVSNASADFVKQAEQVALFDILTEKQAEQVESAIK
jgi:beta-lactamase regulating signal transducer with metallopeptidase domain